MSTISRRAPRALAPASPQSADALERAGQLDRALAASGIAPVLDVIAVAAIIGLSPGHTTRLVRCGAIRGTRTAAPTGPNAGSWRVLRVDVARFLCGAHDA